MIWHGYESIRLKLADNTTYTPDFLVQRSDGFLEFHEVKGFWTPTSRVKIKVAAEMYPMFSFLAVQRKKGKWTYEEFGK